MTVYLPQHADNTPRPKCTCGARGYGFAIGHDIECPIRVDATQRLRLGTGGTR